MTTINSNHLYRQTFNSPIGEIIICASDTGLCLLDFNDSKNISNHLKELERHYFTIFFDLENDILKSAKSELENYFENKLPSFKTPLDMVGTEFQKKVWRSLLNIPFGKTISYEQQSYSLNTPEAIRAIANANGKNKISIFIPCHRVIGKNGSLTGYAGGIERKKWLLNHEFNNSDSIFNT